MTHRVVALENRNLFFHSPLAHRQPTQHNPTARRQPGCVVSDHVRGHGSAGCGSSGSAGGDGAGGCSSRAASPSGSAVSSPSGWPLRTVKPFCTRRPAVLLVLCNALSHTHPRWQPNKLPSEIKSLKHRGAYLRMSSSSRWRCRASTKLDEKFICDICSSLSSAHPLEHDSHRQNP